MDYHISWSADPLTHSFPVPQPLSGLSYFKQSSLHSVLVAKLTGASNRLQKPFFGCFKLMNARLQKLIEVLNGPKGMPFWPCIMLVNEIFFSIITYYYICVCICEYVCVCACRFSLCSTALLKFDLCIVFVRHIIPGLCLCKHKTNSAFLSRNSRSQMASCNVGAFIGSCFRSQIKASCFCQEHLAQTGPTMLAMT